MLEKIISEPVLHAGAHLGYFSGISLMLPILGEAWQSQIKPWIVSPYGFIIAAGLVLISIVILGFVAGSVSKLTRSIGWMMLIPGIFALVFAGVGQEQVYHWAENSVTGFATVEPAMSWFVEHSVPKAAYLGGLYVLAGVVLIWVANRIKAVAEFV